MVPCHPFWRGLTVRWSLFLFEKRQSAQFCQCTIGQNYQEYVLEYWATLSSVCSFAYLLTHSRASHCPLCTACFAPALCCAHLFAHSLAHSLTLKLVGKIMMLLIRFCPIVRWSAWRRRCFPAVVHSPVVWLSICQNHPSETTWYIGKGKRVRATWW